MSTPTYTFVPVEEPYDDYERMLLERLAGIHREYEEVAKPYKDALIRSRSMKITRHYVRVNLLPGEKPL